LRLSSQWGFFCGDFPFWY